MRILREFRRRFYLCFSAESMREISVTKQVRLNVVLWCRLGAR
jgi:hypothetical protein